MKMASQLKLPLKGSRSPCSSQVSSSVLGGYRTLATLLGNDFWDFCPSCHLLWPPQTFTAATGVCSQSEAHPSKQCWVPVRPGRKGRVCVDWGQSLLLEGPSERVLCIMRVNATVTTPPLLTPRPLPPPGRHARFIFLSRHFDALRETCSETGCGAQNPTKCDLRGRSSKGYTRSTC